MRNVTDQEFPKDYEGEIALECLNLENALRIETDRYDNSHVLLNKSRWYAMALESDEREVKKDDANKQDILRRIIDSVINFIRMIGKKIAEWFRACKAAILKFFGGDKIVPSEMTARMDILVFGLSDTDADKIISKLSQENKSRLATVLDKNYSTAFFSLWGSYSELPSKCGNVAQFCENYEFFTRLKEDTVSLKVIAKQSSDESIDRDLKLMLTGKTNPDKIQAMGKLFNEANSLHSNAIGKMERILDKLPKEELTELSGNDASVRRRDAVEVLSSAIKTSSYLTMRINAAVQAIATLMTDLVKYRARKIAIIKM